MPKRAINPPSLPEPPKWSRGVEVSGTGRTVYIAGAAPLDEHNEVAGDDLLSQAGACFGKIAKILEEAGGTMNDMVFVTAYLTDISRIGEMQPVRDAHFTGPVYPAMSGVEVAALADPRWLIEVDGVAYIE
jgi:2-iminobutanoate/2-iminopropanoate deaminase